MAYAIIRTKKHKNFGSIKRCENHQCRKVEVSNADKSKSIKLLLGSNDFTEVMKKDYEEYSKSKKIRKNAVLGLEILLTASPEFFTENKSKLLAWAKENIAFLKKEYGEENIVFANLQLDEKTPHISAMIKPIDNKGKLNCSHFVGSKERLTKLQTDYADAMSCFGLKRGVAGSKAKHETIAKYYNKLNRIEELEQKIAEQSNILYELNKQNQQKPRTQLKK